MCTSTPTLLSTLLQLQSKAMHACWRPGKRAGQSSFPIYAQVCARAHTQTHAHKHTLAYVHACARTHKHVHARTHICKRRNISRPGPATSLPFQGSPFTLSQPHKSVPAPVQAYAPHPHPVTPSYASSSLWSGDSYLPNTYLPAPGSNTSAQGAFLKQTACGAGFAWGL